LNAEPPHRPSDHSAPEEGYDIELAPVGLLVAASDGHVMATNQAWSELSNLSGPASAGQGFLAAFAPAERPRFQDDLRQVALGTDQVVGDYHLEAGSTRRRTRWWLRPHNRNGVPLVVMAVGDFTSPLISPAEPGSRLTPAGTPIEVADVIIAELIAIGFTLASCVNIADDMAFSRVAQAVADLDWIVQRLDNSRTQPDQAWGAETLLGRVLTTTLPAIAQEPARHDADGERWPGRVDRSSVDKTSRSTTRTRSGRKRSTRTWICGRAG
jgi:hypothetical protein